MDTSAFGVLIAAVAKSVRRSLEQERPAKRRVPAVGTPYTLELAAEPGRERWVLSLTARKPELFHTTYLCRGSREEVSEFLSAQTAGQWGERADKLLREAEAIYFP